MSPVGKLSVEVVGVAWLVGVVLLVGVLAFVPVLALGPVVEHLILFG